jgi:large subunit ribosomal protein L25
MEATELNVEQRARTGKGGASKARQDGLIPAVIYGGKDPALSVAVNLAAFDKVMRKAGNRLSLFSLKVQGGEGKSEPAIIKAVQRHPVSDAILHIDFLRIDLSKKISVEVPVQVEGTAPGIKAGGVLQQPVRHVRVRCLPNQIPAAAVADVSALDIGGVVFARDLKVTEGVELVSDPDAAVLSIVVTKYEEEVAATDAAAAPAEGAAPAAGAEPAQPEVIGEKERDERRAAKEETKTKRDAEKAEIKETQQKEAKKK